MLEFHPIADLFPLIEGAEFDELVADIKSRGLEYPVILWRNKIIDGRNRYRACLEAGIEPEFEDKHFVGEAEAARYVTSVNIRRRHLTTNDKAFLAAELEKLFKDEARANQGARTDLSPISDKGFAPVHAAEEAAVLVGVGKTAVFEAKKVLEDGDVGLIDATKKNKIAVSTAAVIATEPKAKQKEIIAKGEKEILAAAKEIRERKSNERRTERVQKLTEISAENSPVTGALGRFPVLYADPPWRYEHVETESRAIENQYPTMALDEICALPVKDIATDDAVLFMWATSPKLAESMRVVESWGFVYRTCAVWVKEQIGMGYYFRQKHEILLVCTRGNPPTPLPANRPESVIVAPRTKHSAKPAEFSEAIERMYPELKKIELFCRTPRDGWSVWGNQAAA